MFLTTACQPRADPFEVFSNTDVGLSNIVAFGFSNSSARTRVARSTLQTQKEDKDEAKDGRDKKYDFCGIRRKKQPRQSKRNAQAAAHGNEPSDAKGAEEISE